MDTMLQNRIANLVLFLSLLGILGLIITLTQGCTNKKPTTSIEPCGACVRFMGARVCAAYSGEEAKDAGPTDAR